MTEPQQPLNVGDHVFDEDVELIVMECNGDYCKCNRADNNEYYGNMYRPYLSNKIKAKA